MLPFYRRHVKGRLQISEFLMNAAVVVLIGTDWLRDALNF